MSTFVLVEICDRPGPALRSVCEAETLEGIANRVDDLIEGRLIGRAWNPDQGPVPAEPAVLPFPRPAAKSARVLRAIEEFKARRCPDGEPLVIDVQ